VQCNPALRSPGSRRPPSTASRRATDAGPSPAPLAGTPAEMDSAPTDSHRHDAEPDGCLLILAETEQRLAHTRLPPPSPPGGTAGRPPMGRLAASHPGADCV
jgi:hypothetical protein